MFSLGNDLPPFDSFLIISTRSNTSTEVRYPFLPCCLNSVHVSLIPIIEFADRRTSLNIAVDFIGTILLSIMKFISLFLEIFIESIMILLAQTKKFPIVKGEKYCFCEGTPNCSVIYAHITLSSCKDLLDCLLDRVLITCCCLLPSKRLPIWQS